jgi:hypothetical protein
MNIPYPPLPNNPAICDPMRFGIGYSPDQMRAYAEETVKLFIQEQLKTNKPNA